MNQMKEYETSRTPLPLIVFIFIKVSLFDMFDPKKK